MDATRYIARRRKSSGARALCHFFSNRTKRSSLNFFFFGIFLLIGLSGSVLVSRLVAAAANGSPNWLTHEVNRVRTVTGRLGYTTTLTGTYSGTVYVDYNANGVRDTAGTAPNYALDSGVSGVVITAYNSSGASEGSATSTSNGTFSFTPTGTGPYRLEYTALPSGYYPSASGTNNGTTVRIVANGGATNLDLGLVQPSFYTQNVPDLITNCYVYGAQNAPAMANSPVLVSFPYGAGSTSTTTTDSAANQALYDAPATHTLMVPAQAVGTTFGLAYARNAKRLYAAAFFKRHSGFGPGADGTFNNTDDPGAIYLIDRDTGTVSSTIFTVPNATTNAHNTSNYNTDNGNTGWDAVGKTALGGMDISADETTLYVMNLQNRTLYALNATTGAVITSRAVPTSGVPTTGGTNSTAAAGDVRPFAVRYYLGKVYVGLVTTGESTNSASDLFAHVYEVNATTLAFSASPVFTARLNYARGKASTATNGNADWRNWEPTFTNLSGTANRANYPQPMFTDLVFDNGNLIIGLRDRLGDQIGQNTFSDPSNPTTQCAPRTAGDILRACGSVGSWTLEANGRCGGTGSAPQNTGQGPGSTTTTGSGEFYFGDAYDLDDGGTIGAGSNHDEVALGTLAQIPGAVDVLSTIFDPIPNIANMTFDGGFRWLSNSTGAFTRAYRIYNNVQSNDDPDVLETFGKANGLGDLEILADPVPLQIGNRIWNDADADGVQDANETTAWSAGIAVQLWADTNGDGTVDTQVGSATSDTAGNYYFGGAGNANMLPNTSCTNTITARVNRTDDDAEQTGTTVTLTGTPLELARTSGSADSIVGLRFDSLRIPKGANVTSATLQFTATATDSSTVNVTFRGESNANAAAFTTAASNLSNRTTTTASVNWSAVGTWTAAATTNATSPNLSTIVNEIINSTSLGWQQGNSLAFILTNNGTTGTNRRRAQDADTNPAQAALLSVTYQCPYRLGTNTKYEVRLPASNFNAGQPLNSFVLTDVNADSSTNGDLRDTDATHLGGNVAIALTTGVTGESNHTYDFGFTATTTNTVSLGNRVWHDANNNGVLDGGETGLANVVVNLYNAAGTTLLGTTTTDSGGNYSFPGLTTATDYVVELAASNFNSGGVLEGYRSSLTQPNGTETAPADPDTGGANASDTDDNGQTTGTLGSGGVIRALAVTLTAGSEPTGETNGAGDLNVDNRSNLTVDFGLYLAYTVGNRVWRDNGAGGGTSSNGTLDGSEAGISGVTVGIYADANANGVADGAALATVVTDSNGYYRFDGLAAGSYVVGVLSSNFGTGQPLSGLVSTATSGTSSSNSTDSRDNGVDNGTPGANGIFSGTFNLATKTIPTGEGDNQTPGTYGSGSTVNGPPASNSRGDLTIDFGFIASAPLAARLSGFTAQAQVAEAGVVVRWQTGFEADNLGFNLYRESGGRRVQVNASLIAGSALLAGAGAWLTAGNSYVWPDAQGATGTAYWLEAVDLSGARDWFGPVWASGGGLVSSESGNAVGPDGTLPRARLLAELNAPPPDTAQTEYAAAHQPGSGEATRVTLGPVVPWTLPGQTAVKLLVRQPGWYRVTAAELQAAGFTVNVNPVLLQLFADGVEVPITVKGQGQRVESVDFYGQGLDTPATDTRVYWLAVGQQAGRRLNVTAAAAGAHSATHFISTVERKDKLIYFSGLLNGDAENWFGPVINSTGVVQRLTTHAVNRQALPAALLEVTLQGVTEQAHTVNVEFNGRAAGTANFSGKQRFTAHFPVPLEAVRDGENEVRLVAAAGTSDVSLSVVLRLSYARSFVAVADTLECSLVAGQAAYLSGFSTPDIRVLELGPGPDDVRELTVKAQAQAGSYGFSLQSVAGGTYVVLTEARLARVAGVRLNQPSNWRAVTNAAEFVLVTHRDFWAAAQRLAAQRRASEMRVAVVDIEDVYDEFNYGARAPQALKEMLSYARANWLRKPSYALLLGDATNDPRNYLGQGDYDFVPTYMGATSYFETGLDNWLVDANEDGVPEYALGRLPVRTVAQAELAVTKTLAYKPPPTPRNSLFVSDRTVEGVNFQAASEQLANQLPPLMSKQFINRLDGSPEQVRNQVLRSLNLTMPLVVNWQGHGSTQVWTGDGLLRAQDAGLLTAAAPGLFVLTTCLNGYFTDPQQQSLGEAVLLNTTGGAFAVIASSALNQPGAQQTFNLVLYQGLFGKGLSLGEALQQARAVVLDADVRNSYTLFGDPTLRLSVRR